MDDTQQIISEITSFHDNVLPDFQKKWDRALRNIGIYGIDHWSEEDKKKHKQADRVEVNMPQVTQKINALLGFEKENRTHPEFNGQGKEDELNAEVLTKLLRWTENQCKPKYEYIKSDLFRDACIPCHACLEIYEDVDRTGRKVVKARYIPYNQVVWDLNFTDVEFQTCSRMQKFRWVYYDDLVREYPDKKKELESTTLLSYELENSEYYPQRKLENYYENIGEVDGKRKYLAKVLEDYQRVNHTVYELHKIKDTILAVGGMGQPQEIPLPGDPKEVYETKKDAEAVMNQRLMEISQLTQVLDPSDYYIIKKVTEQRIKKTVISGNVLLEEPTVTEEDDFDIIVLFSYFFNGEWWTPTDVSRDPQLYFDRVFSQIDEQIGQDVKNTMVLYPNNIHPSQPLADAKKNLTKGGIIYGLNDQKKVAEAVQRMGANGQYFDLLSIMQSLIEDVNGGRNFSGLQESANQSGKAIDSLQAGAAQMTLNFLVSLQRFDIRAAERFLSKMMKVYDYEMKIKVMGDDFTEQALEAMQTAGIYEESSMTPGIGWLHVNKDMPIAKYETGYDIQIEPVTARKNEREITYNKLLAYTQTTGYPVPPDMWGWAMGLKPTHTSQLKKEKEEQEQLQLKQMQYQALMGVAQASEPDPSLLKTMNEIKNGNGQNNT